ncbi:hypothetical protein [Halanaerobium salsuginis]|jgi:hypothetical protein|uniref:Uncharacterized protein n=1 Tax=Halanaerobium salsuginis TaxID=29563 RepID=A0A1I4JV31_9FIRM|nr:hypothetical protein [Halanaerobium salsuginis]SFL70191.1 hypothetical protein SAMN02983006_01823 [Halanaerobium salsuginis]
MLKRMIHFIDEVASEGKRIENNLRKVKNEYRNDEYNGYMNF